MVFSYGGHGAVGFRGGDQQAGLQDEGGGLNLRQACDKLTTRLATYYRLEVNFMTRPMMVREDSAPYEGEKL